MIAQLFLAAAALQAQQAIALAPTPDWPVFADTACESASERKDVLSSIYTDDPALQAALEDFGKARTGEMDQQLDALKMPFGEKRALMDDLLASARFTQAMEESKRLASELEPLYKKAAYAKDKDTKCLASAAVSRKVSRLIATVDAQYALIRETIAKAAAKQDMAEGGQAAPHGHSRLREIEGAE